MADIRQAAHIEGRKCRHIVRYLLGKVDRGKKQYVLAERTSQLH